MLGYKEEVLDTTPVAIKVNIQKGMYIDKKDNISYQSNINYTGKDIYIGIVTSEDIDYFNLDLLKNDKTSKVRCIWKQTEEEDGSYNIPSENIARYISRDIRNDMKRDIQENINDTTWLRLTTGNGKEIENRSLIPDSEILVAKINSAPINIQTEYSLDEQPGLCVVKDILIGVKKLVELAKLNSKPIVIYIPYNYVLGGLDGLNIYDREFRDISYMNGVTLVMPAGEQADKSHREVLSPKILEPVEIICKNEKEIIRGKIGSPNGNIFKVAIVPNGNDYEKIYIDERGEFEVDGAKVYTTGIWWEDSGEFSINFKILQETNINWQVVIEEANISEGDISISLAEGDLSRDIVLSSSTGSNTMNTGIYRWGAIGVGSFDTHALVTMKSSGRASKQYANRLACVADGRIYLDKLGENGATMIEGTSIACSKVIGVLVLLYEYFMRNIEAYSKNANIPNTPMMKRWLRGQLSTLSEQEYPNMSQGYGVLDINKVSEFINQGLL